MPLVHSLNWRRNANLTTLNSLKEPWMECLFDCFATWRSLTEIAPSALMTLSESEQSIKWSAPLMKYCCQANSHLPTYLPTYLIPTTYVPTYLPTLLNTYLPTYLIPTTYVPTYLSTTFLPINLLPIQSIQQPHLNTSCPSPVTTHTSTNTQVLSLFQLKCYSWRETKNVCGRI